MPRAVRRVLSVMLRVVQVGLGPVGLSLARLVLDRRGLELVGAADPDPRLTGRDLGELAGCAPLGTTAEADADAAVARARPDVVLHATGSHLPEVADQFRAILRRGVSIVSTCEELAYPFYRHPGLASELDALARENRAILLGTGVNPGFVMDKLVATLLGACRTVSGVRVRRVVDASRRREPLQRKVGAGLTPDEFETRRKEGRIGHVGLAESAHMLADVIGVGSERRLTEHLAPKIVPQVQPAQVAGIEQLAVVAEGGEERVRLELEMYVGAEEAADEVWVAGSPPLQMSIRGGVHGDEGTAAVVVNCACLLGELRPGLRTMLDVPLRFARGSRRALVE